MLARFLNRDVTIMELTTVSGKRKAFQTVSTADYVQPQAVEDRYTLVKEGVHSKVYETWFDEDVTIREGMKLRDEVDNRVYKVIGVDRRGQGLGLMSEHLHVLLQRFTE